MKNVLLSLSLILTCAATAFGNNDSLLVELKKTIEAAANYDAAKLREIETLKRSLPAGTSLSNKFAHYERIYDAYKIFSYDSAYSYARSLVRIAGEMRDPGHTAAAQLKLSFILLSAGLYKETYDSLGSISNRHIPDSLKGEYFSMQGRYYFDLAGYANDHYHSVDYDIQGVRFIDSALLYYPQQSFEYIYYSGLRNFKTSKVNEAATFFGQLLNDPQLTYHQYALTASTLSGIYLQQGNMNKGIELLILATVADIKSSTKETVAIFHLAELLYKIGDLQHAAMCIESAIANAEFYGARQRKLQASSILPLIEGERINGIEKQKSILIKYAIVVTLLVLTLLILAWIILRQVKKLKHAQFALTLANERQHEINLQLEQSNLQLAEVNDKLAESNKIKEEYLGYFFNVDSEFYGKIGKIKSTIEQKLVERRYEDIRFFLNKIDTRKEKEELLLSFDKIFLKLFPRFVDEVNALLRSDERIVLKEGELLSTDLRIFALMRMGVTDPEKIAQILEYSVKTIYSYKSRLKNKALVSDTFEEKVMRL